MRKFVSSIIIALCVCKIFAQNCPMVIAIDGGSPLGSFQWSIGSPNNLGECPLCGIWDRQASFQLLGGNDTTQTIQFISSYFPPCPKMQVKIANGCDTVNFDTCQALPLTGLGCLWQVDALVRQNSQLLAFWRSDSIDSVGILVVPALLGRDFDTTLYLIDTCGIPLRLEETPAPPVLKANIEQYYPLESLQRAGITGVAPTPIRESERLPNVLYKKVATLRD